MAIQNIKTIEKFVAPPHAEVLGVSMLSLSTTIKSEEIMPLLERHGFANIDPEKWYPQQPVLEMYRDLVEGRSNVSENLVAIGVRAVETMEMPPEVNSPETLIPMMVSSYDMFHRNTWPGEGATSSALGKGHIRVILNMPYPDDIFYGYYWGMMKRYVPKNMTYKITPVPNKDVQSDQPGTIYDIQWGAKF